MPWVWPRKLLRQNIDRLNNKNLEYCDRSIQLVCNRYYTSGDKEKKVKQGKFRKKNYLTKKLTIFKIRELQVKKFP